MAKKVDPLKAKAAKQKKIAIGLVVALVAVMAVQGPKTLKMLKGPQPVSTADALTPIAPPAGSPPVPAAPGGVVPAAGTAAPVDPSAGAAAAVLVDSDVAPPPGEGQLISFEEFASKDPFAQQVSAGGSAASPADGDVPSAGDGAPTAGAGRSGGGSSPGGGSGGGGLVSPSPGAGGSGSGSAQPVSPPVIAPAPPRPTIPISTATVISVNGVSGPVAITETFPEADPVFVLVRLGTDGKSVEIGIAGGSYADGEETITLELGKPLTLQNTADGARYELKLLAVGPQTAG